MRNVPRRAPALWRVLLALLAALAVVALAACGDDEGDDNGSGGGSGGEAASAEERLDELYAGTFQEPPAESPPPQADKNVWVISLGKVLPAGVQFADAAEAAGEDLGWDVTVFDGKLSPEEYQTGIRQAIADGADGILLHAIDCPVVTTALEEAEKARIPVVAAESADCDEPQFDSTVDYVEGDFLTWGEAIGEAAAAMTADAVGGEGTVLEFFQNDIAVVVAQHEGFQKGIKDYCPDCEVVQVEFTNADVAGGEMQRKAEQALVENPDAKALVVPYDDLLTGGVAAAVQASGRSNELFVVGAFGYEDNVELIRNDQGEDASIGASFPWEAYHGLDTLNRLFNNESAAPSGIGLQAFDRDHNLPESGDYEPPVDFRSAYQEAWGE